MTSRRKAAIQITKNLLKKQITKHTCTVHSVTLCRSTKEVANNKATKEKGKDMRQKLDKIKTELNPNKTPISKVPEKYHNSPEAIEAKEMEINNLPKYGAFEEVEDHGQERTASRWVITQKNNQES